MRCFCLDCQVGHACCNGSGELLCLSAQMQDRQHSVKSRVGSDLFPGVSLQVFESRCPPILMFPACLMQVPETRVSCRMPVILATLYANNPHPPQKSPHTFGSSDVETMSLVWVYCKSAGNSLVSTAVNTASELSLHIASNISSTVV